MPPETELPKFHLYGVGLATILNDDTGNVRYGSAQALRRGLRLPAGAKLALLGGCNDEKLNKAWSISRKKDLWRRIADLEFTVATSFSYSVYDHDPRSDQIINQMKNFMTYEYLCSLGVPCVPFVFFNPHSTLDVKNVIEWLEDRPDVTRIAMLAQSYVNEFEFERVLEEMRRLRDAINRPIEFLIVGVGAASKLRSLASEFPTATITTEWPVIAGLNGRRILPHLKEEIVPKQSATKSELVRSNLQQFRTSLYEIRQSCVEPLVIVASPGQLNFTLPV